MQYIGSAVSNEIQMKKELISQLEKKDIFRILFESAGEGLVLVDTNGTILMTNPRVGELFQYNDHELIGKPIEVLIPADLRHRHAEHREAYNEMPRKRSMSVAMDLAGQKKDGARFPVEVSLNYFRAGDDILIMGLITDITERKKIEQELQKLNSELEERVVERTRDLGEAVKKLEETNKSLEKAEEEVRNALVREKELSELKSRFVSTASHEFRTPLATILSSVSLIGKYSDPGNADKKEKHISRIKSAVNNLKDILNDFLSLEKLEEGKVHSRPETLFPGSFIAEIAEELEPLCKPGQEIVHSFAGIDSQEVRLDPFLLKNILLNLISNAIKFSPEHSRIYVKADLDGGMLNIEIRDGGIGISAEDQKHLFERFFRGRNSINIQGTGLGLNIVKKYLELMNGKITLQSEINRGTTLYLSIPRHIS